MDVGRRRACSWASNSLEVGIEVLQDVVFDGVAGVAEFLPVGHFGDDATSFGANGIGSAADVVTELGVADSVFGGVLKFWRGGGASDAIAHCRAHLVAARISAR